MSSEQSLPEWFVGKDADVETKRIASVDYERINRVASGNLSEDDIVAEREEIEKCASSKEIYYSNVAWGKKTKTSLKEYASICNVDYKEVSVPIQVEASVEEKQYIKTASSRFNTERTAAVDEKTQSIAEDLKSVMSDPFKLAAISDERATTPRREDWEKITPQQKLSEKPTMMTGNIIPIGGGEDYNKSPEPKLAVNQNSITNPNAIGEFAESDTKDTGEYLREQAENRKKEIQQSNKEWEDSKVDELKDALKGSNMTGRGSVFLTEALDAQPGLNTPSSQMGVYADFSKDDIPDKTQGEQLHEQAEARRQSIQRGDKEAHEFELNKAPTADISDIFTEALKKELGKIENK